MEPDYGGDLQIANGPNAFTHAETFLLVSASPQTWSVASRILNL